MISSIGNKPSLERGFLWGSPRKLRFGTFDVTICFGPCGLSTMTGFPIKSNGMSLRSNTPFGMTSFYAKVAWEKVVKYVNVSVFSAEALLKGFVQTWGARSVLCGCDNLIITWNWKRKLWRLFGTLISYLMAWEVSLACGVGVVLG